METLNPLTIDQAATLVPAINSTGPNTKLVSSKYQFISTREILEKTEEFGWRITNAVAQSNSPFAQHRITMMLESDLKRATKEQLEGVPRIELFNSHNRSKRLMFAVGFFRFVCTNGLISAFGPADVIRTKHRFSDGRLDEIMEQVEQVASRFPRVTDLIEQFKEREMSDTEQRAFAKYAVVGRFNYRTEIPKRVSVDMNRTVTKLLEARRDEDAGNSTWQVFNRVQENVIKGIEGFSRPLKGYSDTIRVNQLLWKGAEVSLTSRGSELESAYKELLVKDGTKGKISC